MKKELEKNLKIHLEIIEELTSNIKETKNSNSTAAIRVLLNGVERQTKAAKEILDKLDFVIE